MSQKPTWSQKTQRPPKSNGFKDIHIDEEVKIAVNLSLERFRYSEQKEMEFPSSLTSTERAFIHRLAQSLGYVSKSKGKGPHRFLTLRKKGGSHKLQPAMPLPLSHSAAAHIRSLLLKHPVSSKERADAQHAGSRLLAAAKSDGGCERVTATGRLKIGIPRIPHRRRPTELDRFRRSLPVYERQEEIVKLIKENRVVLVLGETGSGKTTQIPQFLLDDCCHSREPCRIFCTQPRRLAAIAVAERVAAERGETVGGTVGYHIRLESRVSPKTLLTFCTSGVFLRTLMAGEVNLMAVTHVIVDEVHERDGLTDTLLTKLRDVLHTLPTLKLVLSSAALDTDLFLRYFDGCPVIHLKGRQYEVKQLFLEDVLRLTGFSSKDVVKFKEETQRMEKQQKALTEWCQGVNTSANPAGRVVSSLHDGRDVNQQSVSELQTWLLKETDVCITNIFLHEQQDAFVQLLNLILTENVSVDYTHSDTGVTPLMAAAARGFLPQMERLLSLGANVDVKAANGWTAFDFAVHFQQADALDLLRSSIPLEGGGRSLKVSTPPRGSAELSAEDQELLKLYHHSFDDERVDLDLIMDLLHNICSTSSDGAVLIFLPGYDEIVSLRDRILDDDKRFSSVSERYQVFTLHSDMQTSDQRKAMKTSPPGVRKIILSTNIAETSITINDVVFVIDSGKVKEKSFDTLTHVSMLKTVWISKASALQRRGRAGRCKPGVCFHLFSRLRFSSLLEFQVPQLLRMPLQELCLQTKLLAPASCLVSEFLSRVPQPPPAHSIRNAVEMLKTIDAMDQNEDLTDLGFHLADLPVEPHLGKMVLCAVVLKCLDPILTIACTLSYRDPFVLPAQGSQKRAALHTRKSFTASSFSDHMAPLRAFQAWQNACSQGWERSFCENNFLSHATLDMILGMRTQLLGQLRAIGLVRAHGFSDIRDVNVNSENWAVVKAALVAGMYPNLVHINQRTSVLSSHKEKKIHFHPTSVLNPTQLKEDGRARSPPALPTDWLIYGEMSRGHRMASVRCCSLVTAVTVAIFAGCGKQPSSSWQDTDAQEADSPLDDSDSEGEGLAELSVDDWLRFQMDKEASHLVSDLRQKWQNLFVRRMRCSSKALCEKDESVLQTLVSVLSAEEQEAGLQQPAGIGQRPRPMASEEEAQPCERSAAGSPRTHTANDSCSRAPALSGPVHNKPRSRDPPASSMSPCSGGVDRPPSSGQFFVMRSSSVRNIEISQQKGIWSTTPSVEAKLSRAFADNSIVLLVFVVKGSGLFHGFARMTSAVCRESCQDGTGLDGVFSVEWLRRDLLPIQRSQHLLSQSSVDQLRDGQELDAHTGQQLLLLWE